MRKITPIQGEVKNITVEEIRLLRLKYRHDLDLVRVLTELLEYREAEDHSDETESAPIDTRRGTVWYLPKFVAALKRNTQRESPRTGIEIECGKVQ